MNSRADRPLSPLFSACFMQAVLREIREYGLEMILRQQNLLHLLPAKGTAIPTLHASEFAALQAGLRRYYGRGARSLLMRIGRGMWRDLVNGQPLLRRVALNLQRSLPTGLRVRSMLDFLVEQIRSTQGDLTLQSVGADLLLLDRSSDGTLGQEASEPVCWLMQSLVQEALFWATRVEYEVEEVACRGMGDAACQFRIRREREEG